MAAILRELLGKTVFVITNDGKNYVGLLRGVDQTINVILEDCVERICTVDEGIKPIPEGLKIIRGDNVAIIAEMDEEKENSTDLRTIHAQPLKPVIH